MCSAHINPLELIYLCSRHDDNMGGKRGFDLAVCILKQSLFIDVYNLETVWNMFTVQQHQMGCLVTVWFMNKDYLFNGSLMFLAVIGEIDRFF